MFKQSYFRLLLLRLLGLLAIIATLTTLTLYFNITKYISGYLITFIAFLAYCGVFSFFGIDDIKYFYNRFLILRYCRKYVNVTFTIYKNPQLPATTTYKFMVASANFTLNNTLYFTLTPSHQAIKFYAKINPLTQGVTLLTPSASPLPCKRV